MTTECCVCQTSDKRALVEVVLRGGEQATLCGSHAVMYRRAVQQAGSVGDLRVLLRDKRTRRERRDGRGDALGAVLSAAFSGERRAADRRGA